MNDPTRITSRYILTVPIQQEFKTGNGTDGFTGWIFDEGLGEGNFSH